ncbi:DUF1778 domain-containing protein [Allochromatium tepidum]|uniref:Ribbon-helix-helix protein CopG domain-containing protein n=1 Tax=Allochromatium tepidum TaxID=553982 RepID=A0ABM7QR36_9GAMM|nr:DUF1778 domain-containing protein [Allochromatium tepidum]BCU08406.1 hypothetical protein Atep_30830 [Allochromatium tepidum]
MSAIPSSVTEALPTTRPVNLRVREDIRALIDQAARSQGKSRSEFMIDAARLAAEDALLDQTLVRVDAETYARFLQVLDQPPAGEGFERLMRAPTPWAR